jgi:hypothetical protein
LSVAAHGARFVDRPPGRLVATGVPSGPYLVNAGPVPLGATAITAADKHYINGESDYPSHDLVAWSVTWFPWPHLDRTTVIGLGGTIDRWEYPSAIETRRDGSTLVLKSARYDPSAQTMRPEIRSLGIWPSLSLVTWIGWLAITLAWMLRTSRRVDQAARVTSRRG